MAPWGQWVMGAEAATGRLAGGSWGTQAAARAPHTRVGAAAGRGGFQSGVRDWMGLTQGALRVSIYGEGGEGRRISA